MLYEMVGVCVCVHTSSKVCIHMCVHMCACGGPGTALGIFPQMPPTLRCKTGSLSSIELINLARLSGQLTPGVLQSWPSQHWD